MEDNNCSWCSIRIYYDLPEFGLRVVGASRPCAECGVLKFPVYNFLKCSICKRTGVVGINWLHDTISPHVTCYGGISDLIAHGMWEETGPQEYRRIRNEKQWSV